MPFNNSILANEELIRSAIRSRNWVGGLSGWRISRDGDAEFTNLLTRGIISAGDIFDNHVQIGADNTLYPGKALILFKTGHADETLAGIIQAADAADMGSFAAIPEIPISSDQPILMETPPQFADPFYSFLSDPAATSGWLSAGRDRSEVDGSAFLIGGDRVGIYTAEGFREVLDPVDAALTLAANVGAFGGAYSTPTYYVDNFAKLCHVTFMVTRTVASAAIAVHSIATLPVGARPPREFVFPCISDVGVGGERERRINIATSGAISLIVLPADVWAIGEFAGMTVSFPIV